MYDYIYTCTGTSGISLIFLYLNILYTMYLSIYLKVLKEYILKFLFLLVSHQKNQQKKIATRNDQGKYINIEYTLTIYNVTQHTVFAGC